MALFSTSPADDEAQFERILEDFLGGFNDRFFQPYEPSVAGVQDIANQLDSIEDAGGNIGIRDATQPELPATQPDPLAGLKEQFAGANPGIVAPETDQGLLDDFLTGVRAASDGLFQQTFPNGATVRGRPDDYALENGGVTVGNTRLVVPGPLPIPTPGVLIGDIQDAAGAVGGAVSDVISGDATVGDVLQDAGDAVTGAVGGIYDRVKGQFDDIVAAGGAIWDWISGLSDEEAEVATQLALDAGITPEEDVVAEDDLLGGDRELLGDSFQPLDSPFVGGDGVVVENDSPLVAGDSPFVGDDSPIVNTDSPIVNDDIDINETPIVDSLLGTGGGGGSLGGSGAFYQTDENIFRLARIMEVLPLGDPRRQAIRAMLEQTLGSDVTASVDPQSSTYIQREDIPRDEFERLRSARRTGMLTDMA